MSWAIVLSPILLQRAHCHQSFYGTIIPDNPALCALSLSSGNMHTSSHLLLFRAYISTRFQLVTRRRLWASFKEQDGDPSSLALPAPLSSRSYNFGFFTSHALPLDCPTVYQPDISTSTTCMYDQQCSAFTLHATLLTTIRSLSQMNLGIE